MLVVEAQQGIAELYALNIKTGSDVELRTCVVQNPREMNQKAKDRTQNWHGEWEQQRRRWRSLTNPRGRQYLRSCTRSERDEGTADDMGAKRKRKKVSEFVFFGHESPI
jgi:hypothetical protein